MTGRWPASTRSEPAAVPEKCAPTTGVGVEPNPCVEPGGLLRCQLCPASPTYWRRSEWPGSRSVACTR